MDLERMSEAEKGRRRRERSILEQSQASGDGGLYWKNDAVQVN
jgi:hypothetical protein